MRIFDELFGYFGLFLRRLFILFLCFSVGFNPLMVEVAYGQEVIIDPSGNVGFSPKLQGNSRAVVVDIARPNSGGVSHNKYSKFDVEDQNVVLNNSVGSVSTKVAGVVSGNANLSGSAASTIVNEVTGSTGSYLKRSVEVAGAKAHVIIANPNGISCNGCSFINAGSATLSTGTPVIEGGSVRLDVRKGTVGIRRQGLDGVGDGLSAVNLVGRFVVIDGKVTAVDAINVQSGAQSWDATRNRTLGALTADPSGDLVRDMGVDASHYGAMEAGRITIVGNEAGFGVRTYGALSAGDGGIAVSAKDNVVVRSAAASGPVTLSSSSGGVTVENDVSSSAGKVTVSGAGGVTTLPDAGLYGAGGLVFASSAGIVTLEGDLQSDTSITGTSTRSTLRFSGYGTAAGAVDLAASQGVVIADATVIADAFKVTGSRNEVSLQTSALFSAQDVHITAVNFHLGKDVVVAGVTEGDSSRLVVTASGMFRNSADMRHHKTAEITHAGALVNEETGVIESENLRLAFAQPVTNSGIIIGSETVSMDVSQFTNTKTGIVTGKGIAIKTSGNLINAGQIAASGSLALDAPTIDNDGLVEGNAVKLDAAQIILSGNSVVKAATAITASGSKSFSNKGEIRAAGRLTVRAPSILNNGQILTEGGVDLDATTTITNNGAINSANLVRLHGDAAVINYGLIGSYGTVLLESGGYIENRGQLIADDNLVLAAPRFSNLMPTNVTDEAEKQKYAFVRARTGIFNVHSLINQGKISLITDIDSDFGLFQNDGIFSSQGNISLRGRDKASRFVLSQKGYIVAGLKADTEKTDDDKIEELVAGKQLSLNFDVMSFSGRVAADGFIEVKSDSQLILNGFIQSSHGSLALVAHKVTLAKEMELYAGANIHVSTPMGFINNAKIIAKGSFKTQRADLDSLSLSGFGYFSNLGSISAGDASIDIDGAFSNSKLLSTTRSLSINAASIGNSGILSAGTVAEKDISKDKGYDVTVTNIGNMTLVSDAGILFSKPAQLAGEPRKYGVITATGALNFRGKDITISRGTKISGTTLDVSGANFINDGDVLLTGSVSNDWKLSGNYTQSGRVVSSALLTINAATGLSLKAGTDVNDKNETIKVHGGISGSNSVKLLTDGDMNIDGVITGQSVYLESDKRLTTTENTQIFASDTNLTNPTSDLTVKASGSLALNGELISANKLDIRGPSIILDGNAHGALVTIATSGGRFSNNGKISAKGGEKDSNADDKGIIAIVSVEDIYNSGIIESETAINLTSANNINNVQILDDGKPVKTGSIASTKINAKAAGAISNFGKMLGAKEISIDSTSFANQDSGTVTAGAVSIHTEDWIKNYGLIDSYALTANAKGVIYNDKTIIAKTFLSFVAQKFYNGTKDDIYATVTSDVNEKVIKDGDTEYRRHSDGQFFIRTGLESVNNVNGKITADDITFRAGSLDNSGFIRADDVLNVTSLNGSIDNAKSSSRLYGVTIMLNSAVGVSNGGTIGSHINTVLTKKSTVNYREFPKTEIVSISTKDGRFENNADVYAENIDLRVTGDIRNNDGGLIHAKEDINIDVNLPDLDEKHGGDLINRGIIKADNNMFINTESTVINEKSISAFRNLSVIAYNDILNGDLGRMSGKFVLLNAITRSGHGVSKIENNGLIWASKQLKLEANEGSITINKKINAPDIIIEAKKGDINLNEALSANLDRTIVPLRAMLIAGSAINVNDYITVQNDVTLISGYDTVVRAPITTKRLMIDTTAGFKAVLGSLRGSELVALKASHMEDLNDSSDELHIIHSGISNKNISIELVNGSISSDVNFNLTGSFYLKAGGNVYLQGGSLKAQGDVFIYSQNSAYYRNTLYAGSVLTLKADKDVGTTYNLGTSNFNAGKKIQISLGAGDFHTQQWFSDGSRLNFDLDVLAAKIGVNNDLDFGDHKVLFRATQDIDQRDHVIIARKIDYSAGRNILIEFDPFDWRAKNPNAITNSDWWSIHSAGLRGHTLLSQQGITLYAGKDITFISGKVHTDGDLNIVAGGSIRSKPIFELTDEKTRPKYVGWDFDPAYRDVLSERGHDKSKVILEELRPYRNSLRALGNVNIVANGYIELIGTYVQSDKKDIVIQSANGVIIMAAAPGIWKYNYHTTATRRKLFGLKKTVTTYEFDAYKDIYKRTELFATNGSIYIDNTNTAASGLSCKGAEKTDVCDTIISTGTEMSAQNVYISSLNRTSRGDKSKGGSISLGVYDEDSIYTETKKSKSTFIGFTYRDKTDVGTISYNINTGNDILADELLTIESGNDLSITGGSLKGEKIRLTAVGNLNIYAAINTVRSEKYTQTQNLATITTINSGYVRDEAVFPALYVDQKNLTIEAGKINISQVPATALNNDIVLANSSIKDFYNKTLNYHSNQNAGDSADLAKTKEKEFERTYTWQEAAKKPGYEYIGKLVKEGATYTDIKLRDHSWYDKQVQLTPAFQALIAVAVSAVTGGAGLTGLEAAVANAMGKSLVEGVFKGEIDVKNVVRAVIMAGVNHTITSFATDQFDLGRILNLPTNSPYLTNIGAGFSPAQIANRLGDDIANRMISNILAGEKPFAGFDDFGRTFLLTESMKIVHFGIGELGNGKTDWEGSIPHIILHGGTACIFMKAAGGNCAAGFISGGSQAKIAGSKLTDEQKAQIIPLAAALGGFVTSDGKGINVTFGVNIATSGFENNYLKHDQVYQFYNALAACEKQANPSLCRADVNLKYQKISWANSVAMRECLTVDCWEQHRKEIYAGLEAANEIIRNGNLEFVNYSYFSDLTYSDGMRDRDYSDAHSDEFWKTFSAYSTQNCTRADKACMEDFRDDLSWKKAIEVGLTAAEILTPYGTIVDGYECLVNGTASACLTAAASIIPVGGIIVKAGGKAYYRVVVKNGEKVTEEISGPALKEAVEQSKAFIPPKLTIDDKQWGTKLRKHAIDFGLDAAKDADRQYIRNLVEKTGSDPDRVVRGTMSGGDSNGRRSVLFYIKDNHVIVTSETGEFVTILQNGIQNPNVIQALKK